MQDKYPKICQPKSDMFTLEKICDVYWGYFYWFV